MSSTTAQIKKTKEELQKLRAEYLRAADFETKKSLSYQIERRKRLLAELGAGHG